MLQVLAAIVILAWVYTVMAGYHVSLKFIPTPLPPWQATEMKQKWLMLPVYHGLQMCQSQHFEGMKVLAACAVLFDWTKTVLIRKVSRVIRNR